MAQRICVISKHLCSAPTQGPNALTLLPDSVVTDCGNLQAVLKQKGLLPTLLVRDTPAWKLTGAAEKIKFDIGAGGDAVVFDDVTPNPTLDTMRARGEVARANGCKSIVAFGGGTAIDTAKGAAWCLGGGGSTPADKPPPGVATMLPLVAISTTAGTGSETTHFAVTWANNKKFSLADPRLRPQIAVVDPWLHRSIPPSVTAATGLDALCQSLESIWSCGCTADSRIDATKGARLALDHLETAVNNPTPASRQAMAAAAYLGGAAINTSKTTAAHALSYALTSDYKVPHGFAVALTFGHLLAMRRDRRPNDKPVPGTVEVAALLAPDAGVVATSSPETVAKAVDAAVARFRALQIAIK